MAGIRVIKQELRRMALERRDALNPIHREKAEERIRSSFLSLLCLRDADTLLTYYPRRRETDVLPLARICRQRGIRVAYPRCSEEKGIMTFRYVEEESELVPGMYGIPEPPQDSPVYDPKTGGRAICIVPGLLFDREGGRLGYGGGYYDRFLCDFPGVRVGMTMSAFLQSEPLPRGRFDLPIHVLITEKGVTTVHAF